jgi:hypothetical protein
MVALGNQEQLVSYTFRRVYYKLTFHVCRHLCQGQVRGFIPANSI